MKTGNELPAPKLAVVGTGYWGKNHLRNFHSMGALRCICDKNEPLLRQFNAKYPGVDTCFALSDVLARDDIEAIVVATPAESHFDIAREGILAGKHVLVEKPLALHISQAQELIDLADRKERVLMVGHLLRYHAVFRFLRRLVLEGTLGRVQYIYSNRLNLGKIRREENILWSFAPHDVSMILALVGEEPEKVLATGGNYLHRKIADVTTTHLEFASGVKAHIFVSWLHPFKEQKLVVIGDRKMAVFDDGRPWPDKLHLYGHEIAWHNNLPVPTKAEPERFQIPESEPLRAQCEHFLDCVTEGKAPDTDGREGLRVLRVLDASQRSMNRGGEQIYYEAPVTEGRGVDERFYEAEKETEYFVHRSAIVDSDVQVGRGTRIWHFSHVLSGSRIGSGCNIGQNVVVGPDVHIGDGCKVQNNVSVFKGVTLEEGVFCGPSMVFTNVFNPRAHIRRMDEIRPTLVRKGATLGANCTIVCGNSIGRYAFVGAGAVVTKDVPDHAVVVGNPARPVGWVCVCGNRLDAHLECPACGAFYQESERGLIEGKPPNA